MEEDKEEEQEILRDYTRVGANRRKYKPKWNI